MTSQGNSENAEKELFLPSYNLVPNSQTDSKKGEPFNKEGEKVPKQILRHFERLSRQARANYKRIGGTLSYQYSWVEEVLELEVRLWEQRRV